MKWVKKGLIFAPDGKSDWMATHAAVPFADRIGEDRFRIYFCGRDEQNRAQVGYFEIDIKRPREIIYLHADPVIGLGPLGAYDDNGAVSSWLVNAIDGRKYFYYSGMMLGVTVPFYFYLGLAISDDDGRTFRKLSASPILDRCRADPFLTGHACVLREAIWRMWYVSGERWELRNGQPKHYYHIKYAESADGINWDRRGAICIDFKSEDEYAIARPCVLKDDGLYRMWYSYRGQSYRIGYAESPDGINWERKDEQAGIDVSDSGWDSEMIEYAHVFDHKGDRYMLYNGNGYGKSGIGLAILASD